MAEVYLNSSREDIISLSPFIHTNLKIEHDENSLLNSIRSLLTLEEKICSFSAPTKETHKFIRYRWDLHELLSATPYESVPISQVSCIE